MLGIVIVAGIATVNKTLGAHDLMEEIIMKLNCKGEKCCNRKGGCMCLGPQKDHRPQTWWVREGLHYLKDQARFLSKGSRLPIPGLYLLSHVP